MAGSNENRNNEHPLVENKSFKSVLNKCWIGCAKIKNISPKTAIIIGCVVVLLTIIFAFRSLFIVAIVNGSPISRFSVINELETKSGKAALENLVLEKIVNMEANKKGINISDEEINKEITSVEEEAKAQGRTLEQVLASWNMTAEVFRSQIVLQKKVEGLLGDKLNVTETEIETYIKDNNVQIPTGQDTKIKEQVWQQLKQQKLSSEVGPFIESLKALSSIRYFINY